MVHVVIAVVEGDDEGAGGDRLARRAAGQHPPERPRPPAARSSPASCPRNRAGVTFQVGAAAAAHQRRDAVIHQDSERVVGWLVHG